MNVLTTTLRDGQAAAFGEDQAERVLATLTLAFAADPPCRWMYPDPAQYLRHFPAFAQALGGRALADGTAFVNRAGAALWLSPGAEPDEEALANLIEQSVDTSRQADVFALFEEMARQHPDEPHWYLPMVGVEPGWQGRGHGSELIAPVLAVCDAKGLPAYLEATRRRSRALYLRLGFEDMRVIEVGDCPPIVPMLRRPR